MAKHWMRLLAALVACLLLTSSALPTLAEDTLEGVEYFAEPTEEYVSDLEIMAEQAEDPIYEEGEIDLMTPEMLEDGAFLGSEAEQAEEAEIMPAEECSHENTYTTYGYTNETIEIPGDNRYHTYKWTDWEIVMCSDCGAEISRTPYDSSSYKRSHSYGDDGVCTECKHVNTCTHEDAYDDWDWKDWSSNTYEPVDNRYHKVTGETIEYTYCEGCGMQIGGDRAGTRSQYYTHSYDANNYCEQCKHTNTCTHANTYENWSWKDYDNNQYKSINNRYHMFSGAITVTTWCNDCGQRVGEDRESTREEKERHSYNNGVCTDCQHACEHINTHESVIWNPEKENERTYTLVDARYHLVSGEGLVCKYCEDCNQLIGEPTAIARQEKEEHDFDEQGVCKKCPNPYTCSHPLKDTTWDYSDDGTNAQFAPFDNWYHVKTRNIIEYSYCTVCGMRFKEEGKPSTREEKSRHNFDETGKCKDCSFQCQHGITSVDTHLVNKVRENLPADNYYHKVTGDVYEKTVCEICHNVIVADHATGEKKSEMERHSYSNGICQSCKHECAHINTETDSGWQSSASQDTYEPIPGDDRYHYKKDAEETKVTRCADCGKTISQTANSELKKDWHSFYNGECTECGYKCTHSKTHVSRDWDEEDYSYKAIDEKVHERTFTISESVRCDNCDIVITPKTTVTEVNVEAHDFRNGVCRDCFQVCPHTGETIVDVTREFIRYEDAGNDDYHNRIVEEFVVTSCKNCGEVISKQINGQVAKREEHHYDEYWDHDDDLDFLGDNVCMQCGHKRACTHPAVYHSYSIFGKVTYTPVDEYYHKRSGRAWEYDYCVQCGEQIDKRIVEDYTDEGLDQHYFPYDGDVCDYCGYTRNCTHEHIRERRSWDDDVRTVYKDEGNYHTITGNRVIERKCLDCGLWLDDVPLGQVTFKESHTDWDRDGVCNECGHVITCAHNGDTWTVEEWDEYPIYTAIDDASHKATSRKIKYTYCSECEAKINREVIEEKTEIQSHDYTDDKYCRLCHHLNACTHANTFDTYYWEEIGYTPIEGNNYEHRVIGRQFGYTYCTDCRARLTKWNKKVQLGTETHSYDDFGRCTDCDHQNTCAHSNTIEAFYWRSGATYARKDSKVHTITGEYIKEIECTDCGQVISTVSQGIVSDEASHDFVNGVCTACGEEYVCPHKNTKTSVEFGDNAIYVRKDAKTHEVTGLRYEVKTCTDCGKRLASKALGEGVEVRNHSYNWRGVCKCEAISNVSYISAYIPATLGLGETYALKPTAYTRNNKKTNIKYSYSSSNKKVVTVSKKGVLTAKKVGSAEITITAANGLTSTMKVTVKKLPAKFSLNLKKKTLKMYNTSKSACTLKGKFAKGTYATLTFTSSNKKVAKVNEFGYVTAVGNGKCTITAKSSNGLKATCAITVTDPSKVSIKEGKKVSLKRGKSMKLTAVLKPTNSKTSVKWTSSDPKTVSVNAKTGKIKVAKKAKVGSKVTITATLANGKTAKFVVTVKK